MQTYVRKQVGNLMTTFLSSSLPYHIQVHNTSYDYIYSQEKQYVTYLLRAQLHLFIQYLWLLPVVLLKLLVAGYFRM
jgi:hypothetical protein